MLRADELYNEVTQDVASKGASQGMFIGCFIDTATGWISFTCEGKETKHRFKVNLQANQLFLKISNSGNNC
jgi:ryanodine receptor 2